MFPAWTIAAAFGAAIVFVLIAAWLVLGAYVRAHARHGQRPAPERVTSDYSDAWAHARAHPDATRATLTLDTDSDDGGLPVRPALRHDGVGGGDRG